MTAKPVQDKPVLLLARQLPEALLQALEKLGPTRLLDPAGKNLAGATVLVATAVDPIPASLIERLPPSLTLIAILGVGTDGVDLAAAARRGIAVSNTPVVTEDTADLAMALLLASSRRLSACERLLREDDWTGGASQLGRRVHGKSLGIIGFGAIGQAVARRARGFDMSIIYHGPHPKAEAAAALQAQFRPELAALLAEADFISLNCPLTPATRHLINRDSLAQTKPGAILINTGRGPLIDEAALVEALADGRLGGAGLDVFEFEPQITPALKAFNNVTLLPHIGSATAECRLDIAMRAIANIQAFLQHGEPLDRCLPGPG